MLDSISFKTPKREEVSFQERDTVVVIVCRKRIPIFPVDIDYCLIIF